MKRWDKLIQHTTMRLIHYGSVTYDPARVKPITDNGLSSFNKPWGGLWTTPVDSKHSWREWCQDNGFAIDRPDRHFIVEFTGKVIKVDSEADAILLPRQYSKYDENHVFGKVPLWEPLAHDVDAVWLTAKGEQDTRYHTKYGLYGWDCESVLVMNPRAVRQVTV